MAECFTRKNIRQMDFNKRNRHAGQRVTQRNAGMGEGSRVDDDEVDLVVCGLMYAVHQFMLGVALKMRERVTSRLGKLAQMRVDIFQRGFAIVVGFATTEQIQIGAVKDEDVGHCYYCPEAVV